MRNGSGVYTLPKPPFVPNTTISSADVNSDFSDIADALTESLAADGQTPLTGNLKFLSGTPFAPSHSFASAPDTGMYWPGAGLLAWAVQGNATLQLDRTKLGVGQNGAVLTYGNGAVIQPVGAITAFAGNTLPTGWFLCYGQAVIRTSYPELFTVIGTTYGSGDGVLTFNLPDLRGRFIAGKDDMGGSAASRITNAVSGITATTLGAAGRSQSQTLITANLPPYTPAGTNAASSITITGQGSGVYVVNAGGPSQITGPGSGIGAATLGGSAAAQAFTGIAQGGTSDAFTIIPPTMIMNYIIFTGRA